MTDFHEDKDEMNEVTKESLGNLMVSSQSPKKRVQIRQEDIRMIVSGNSTLFDFLILDRGTRSDQVSG